MTVNIPYLTLKLLMASLLNVHGKKCCNKDCTVAISTGRTLTSFQDHFPGFLTYEAGKVVRVLSMDEIKGVEFWEAEIEGTKGYIVPSAVEVHSKLCTPVEIKDGEGFLAKKVENPGKVNIYSSELIFTSDKNNPDKNNAWIFTIPSLKSGLLQGLEILEMYVELIDVHYIWDTVKDFVYSNASQVIGCILILIWIINSNISLRKQLEDKEGQIAVLIERNADAIFHNCLFNDKVFQLENLVQTLEEKIKLLTEEKENAEHRSSSFQDTQRSYLLDLNHLRTKIQQLENQAATMQADNSSLLAEKKYCVKTVAKLMYDLKGLEATKVQLEEERYRLETELSKSNTEYLKMSKDYKDMEMLLEQLKSELAATKIEDREKEVTINNLNSELTILQKCMIEMFGKDNWKMKIANPNDDMELMEAQRGEQQLSKIQDILNTSKIQKQLSETKQQRDEYKSNLEKTTCELEYAESNNQSLHKSLRIMETKLEVCKKYLANEKAKSEVIVEYYKDTVHSKSGVHTCSCVQNTTSLEADALKECHSLRDQVQKLLDEMRNMELSYITRLNNEIKDSIEKNTSLQKVEEELHHSQHEVIKCHKRIAELEIQLSSVQHYNRASFPSKFDTQNTSYSQGNAFVSGQLTPAIHHHPNFPIISKPTQNNSNTLKTAATTSCCADTAVHTVKAESQRSYMLKKPTKHQLTASEPSTINNQPPPNFWEPQSSLQDQPSIITATSLQLSESPIIKSRKVFKRPCKPRPPLIQSLPRRHSPIVLSLPPIEEEDEEENGH